MYVPVQAANALSEKFDPNSSPHCWCNRTMTEVGEDDELVGVRACSDPARRCYKSL